MIPSAPAESSPVIRADASYLITGGLGGLGLALARWLVGAGARHLVLVGRRGATAATQRAAIAALEADGARVLVAQADVAEHADVERVLAVVAAELPPLRGVIHAAAVNEPGMLVQQDGARFARSLRAKAVGAWHLHTLTSACALDFFVFYSSVASLLGSPGQGNYVAANSYVDALAHHRRALGQVALSINWGSFGDVGSAAETNRDNRLANRGLHSLTVEEGHAALEWLLGTSAPQVGVVPMDVRQYLEFYPQLAVSPLWSELVASARVSDEESGNRTVRAELSAASPAARRGILERVVRTSGATVLRLDPAELPLDEPLMSLGIDSLMGLELRSRLEVALGLRLSGTLIWAYPTIAKLVDYLLDRIAEVVPPPSETTFLANFANSVPVLGEPNFPNVSAEDLERLSVEEKEALLERTLAELEDRPSD
jgi:acyl carrier protein